jgi:hypothetical protein
MLRSFFGAGPVFAESLASGDAFTSPTCPKGAAVRQLPIYLDYSAPTPVDPRVAEKMIRFLC